MEEVLSTLVRLSTERILQEALEQEQAAALGRGRDEARGEKLGYRNGYEKGMLKTAEGIFQVKLPQIRGRADPFRAAVWGQLAPTRDVLKRLIVEMYVGGMWQREIEYRLESALGPLVLGKSTVSELSATLSDEYEAWRTRALSQETVPYLFIDTVDEPLRRWGQKTGILCVWTLGEDGGKVLVSLSTTQSESYERCVEVLRGVVKRGMRTPITITTAGARGLRTALDTRWPKALRIRWWFHQMQTLQHQVPTRAWPDVKALLVDMGDAPPREKAEKRRDAIVEQYQREFPELCRWLLDDAEASLNPLAGPQRHQQYGRTATLVARAVVEERRRTKVIAHLWDEGSVVRLVYGVLIRVSDRWGTKCFREVEQQQIRSLREQLKLDEQEVRTTELSVHIPTRRSAASAA